MDKKPRIAFCFSGQARTLDQTYQFFQKNLFDAAKEQGFDYDVFCAVEDDENVNKVNLLSPIKVEKIKSSDVETLMPFNINNDNDLKYFNCDYAQFLPWVVQQQWYKIGICFLLKEKYQKNKNIDYDIVFRLRFDTYFCYKLNFLKIKQVLSKKKQIVICNKFEFNPNKLWSISDIYFICNDNISFLLSKSLFDNYGILIYKIVALRFCPVYIASEFIRIILKLDYKFQIFSDKIKLYLKKKYMYGKFVPELILYKYFIANNMYVYKTF